MRFIFILVEPKLPENVGAAARTMKTMGFGDTTLVNPCDHLGERARCWRTAPTIFCKRRRFSTLLPKRRLISISLSAPRHGIRQDYFTGDELPHVLRNKGKMVRRVGVAFGREDRGLLNKEIEKCCALATTPMSASYPSLNLAQAVKVFACMLSPFVLNLESEKTRMPQRNEFRALKNRVRALLTRIDLERTQNFVLWLLERMAALTEEDVHLLHSICSRLEDKLAGNDRSSWRKGQVGPVGDARS